MEERWGKWIAARIEKSERRFRHLKSPNINIQSNNHSKQQFLSSFQKKMCKYFAYEWLKIRSIYRSLCSYVLGFIYCISFFSIIFVFLFNYAAYFNLYPVIYFVYSLNQINYFRDVHHVIDILNGNTKLESFIHNIIIRQYVVPEFSLTFHSCIQYQSFFLPVE